MFRYKTVALKFKVLLAFSFIFMVLPTMAQALDFEIHDAKGEPTPEYLQFLAQFPRERVFMPSAPVYAGTGKAAVTNGSAKAGSPDGTSTAGAKTGAQKAATGKLELVSDESYDVSLGEVQSRLELYYNGYGLAHRYGYGQGDIFEAEFFHATPERRCTSKSIRVAGEHDITSATYLLTNCEGEQSAAFFFTRNTRENEPDREFAVHPRSGQLSIEFYENVAITVIPQPNGELMRLFPSYEAYVPRTLLFDDKGWRLRTRADFSEAEKRELRARAAKMTQLADPNSAASKELRKKLGGIALPDADAQRLCLDFAIRAVYLSEMAGDKTDPLLPLLRAAMPEEFREYAGVLLSDIVTHVSSVHDVDIIDLSGIPHYKLIPYTVQAGDTMLAITRKFPCELPGLRRANKHLRHSDAIKIGETLQVPVPADFKAN